MRHKNTCMDKRRDQGKNVTGCWVAGDYNLELLEFAQRNYSVVISILFKHHDSPKMAKVYK